MKRFLCSLLIIGLILVGCSSEKSQSNEEVENKVINTPYEFDDGKLVLGALFEASIINVDANDEVGEDIASLEITNQSGTFLQHASFDVKMSDDITYHFELNDLPDGENIWIFEKDNLPHQDSTITSIDYSTSYLDSTPIHQGEIQIDVNGTTVTLTNLASNDFSNLTVSCHDTLDRTIYGGVVYLYNIQSLPALGTISFEASDCVMDSPMVVGISY